MADQFEILAKVKLDTSNIQSQLDKIKLKDINVGAKAGSGGLSDQTVRIGADTSDFEMSISVANAIMREFMEIAGQMVDQVYELDGAMTELIQALFHCEMKRQRIELLGHPKVYNTTTQL